ncbi:MAG: hypothetical protein E7300_10135 [Lachnospiraceae bacterium]|nr:hypothetical protein [Lachnospiraceae bacterium]
MEEQMRKAGFRMSFLMALTMSLCLSLVNNLVSAGFHLPLLLITFVTSFVVSLLIGILVPMPHISRSITEKCGPGIVSHLLNAFVSDLIYTPVMTLLMVAVVRISIGIISGGREHLPPLLFMFLRSMALSFAVAYVVILVVTPIFRRLAFGKNG